MELLKNILARLFGRTNDDKNPEKMMLATRWTQDLLTRAAELKASEIRIELIGNDVSVVFRVGDKQAPGARLRRDLLPCVAQHLKRLVTLEVNNTKRRQIGTAKITLANKAYLLKLSTIALTQGECLYIHLAKER